MRLEHPRHAGEYIDEIRDTVSGYRGTWHKPDGSTVPVDGTWALGTPLSWKYHTHTTPDGFRAGEYIVICGPWQN